MRKQRWSSLVPALGLLLQLPSPPAGATICSMDPVPGATVLYPYFEVDVSDAACQAAASLTTLFTVRNETDTPALGFVTVWSDLAVPVVGFNVYLTGYDTQTIDLKELLCDGHVPATGSAVSPLGAFSIFGTFPGCNATTIQGDPPVYPPDLLDADDVAHLKAHLTGQQSSLSGDCAGLNHGDEIARGYVTIDNGTACHLNLPSQAEYYTNGYLSLNNQLSGYFDIIEVAPDRVTRFPGLSLEADASLTGIAGGPTFYGRYNSTILGFEYADGREPLPTTWGARFARVQPDPGTSLIVWREANAADDAFACGSAPIWYPLDIISTGSVVHFDEFSNPWIDPPPLPGFPPTPWFEFPLATQRTSPFPPASEGFDRGWDFFNLSNTVAPTASNSGGQAVVLVEGPAGGPLDRAQVGFPLTAHCPATTIFTAPAPLSVSGWGEGFLFSNSFE